MALSLTLSTNTVLESAGTNALIARIGRNGPTTLPLQVNLSAGSGRLQAVPILMIPAGQASVSTSVGPADDELVLGNLIVGITAAAQGYETASNVITVVDNDQLALQLTLDNSELVEGAINPLTPARVAI